MNPTTWHNGNNIELGAIGKGSLFFLMILLASDKDNAFVFIKLISSSSWAHRETTFPKSPCGEMRLCDWFLTNGMWAEVIWANHSSLVLPRIFQETSKAVSLLPADLIQRILCSTQSHRMLKPLDRSNPGPWISTWKATCPISSQIVVWETDTLLCWNNFLRLSVTEVSPPCLVEQVA